MTTRAEANTPIHLWVIGTVALFWNLIGSYDFLQAIVGEPTYFARAQDVSGSDPETVVAITQGFPLWVFLAWGVATIGATIGSFFLLRRDGWAVIFFALSLAGIAVFTFYQVGASVPAYVTGMTSALFPIAIWSMMTFLLIYAWSMRKRGVLR